MGSDAGDDRGGDWEGEEGEDGALGREARAEAEDWVLSGLIQGEIAFEGAGSGWPLMWEGDGVREGLVDVFLGGAEDIRSSDSDFSWMKRTVFNDLAD